MNGHTDTVVTLLERGADINVRDKRGRTPLDLARQHNHGTLVELLESVPIKRAELWAASRNGNTMTVVTLLNTCKWIRVNTHDEDGRTALHISSMNGHTDTMVALLERGADINVKDKHQRTALHVAGNVETARALIDAGADLDARDEDKAPPSYVALKQGRTDVAQELASSGRNQDMTTRKVENTMDNYTISEDTHLYDDVRLESDDLDSDQVVSDDETQVTMAKELYEEALKYGSVNMSIIKCLVLGIAGVGKTCLKRLLLQLPQKGDGPIGRVSTGLAENPIQVLVGSVSSILMGVDEKDAGKWEVLDEIKLMKVIANAYQVNISPPGTPPPLKKPIESTNEAVHDITVSQSSFVPISSPINKLVNSINLESQPHLDPATEEVDSLIIEMFKRKIFDWKELNVKLVHFIDSGGQPQFLELLPAFVQDFSALLYAVNLSEELNHYPMIYFYGQDCKAVGDPYESPSSHIQALHQCVRATCTGDVHSQVFVVGTHRDKENECSEKKKDKDVEIRKKVPPERLVQKNEGEVIWDVNGFESDSYDQSIANNLRKAIVRHCSNGAPPPPLPMKWFILEMQISRSATRGVLSFSRCLELAQRLDIDLLGLEAALQHMIKYNLLLWYRNVSLLKEIVISDPQVILKIITDLVQCKHNPAALCNDAGFKGLWRSKFKDHAIVNRDFLSHDHFRHHFIDGIFSKEHFIALMCHLFIMVELGDGDYLMPALLDPCNGNGNIGNEPVNPLLICFPNEIVPRGLFSCLVAFLQTQCNLLEENKVPVCLYRDCVSFKHKRYPAQFTIIDSVSYIRVHLEPQDVCSKKCFPIKRLIHNGIKKVSEVLRYSKWKDIKDGFFCSCGHAAIPYEEDFSKAACSQCNKDMNLTSEHTVWLSSKESNLGGEEEWFRTNYDNLQSQLNPDDITGKLYSQGILTKCEKEDINNSSLSLTQRVTKLLDAVERAIKADPRYLCTFLHTLETIPRHKAVVEKAKNDGAI